MKRKKKKRASCLPPAEKDAVTFARGPAPSSWLAACYRRQSGRMSGNAAAQSAELLTLTLVYLDFDLLVGSSRQVVLPSCRALRLL